MPLYGFKYKKLILVTLVLAGTGGCIGIIAWQLNQSFELKPQDRKVTVDIAKGQTLRSVLQDLHKQQLLSCPQLLYRYAQLSGKSHVPAGIIALPQRYTPLTLLTLLQKGQVMLQSLLIPEGINRFQLQDLLAAQQLMSKADFKALCDDKKLLAREHIPGPSCEGYLFPNTYKLARGISPENLMLMLLRAYRQVIAELQPLSRRKFGPYRLTERQFVTLASIVEKETAEPSERPHIAAVFYNRLKAKPAWRLETDPTVIYAAMLELPHFDGNLTRAMLHELISPYNTYRVKGLPPGPIANPGLAAMQAVLHPQASSGDYFFVATNQGRHIFCPDIDCHQRAVNTYQVRYFQQKHPLNLHGTVKRIPVPSKRKK